MVWTHLYTRTIVSCFFLQKTPGTEWLDYIHQPYRVDIYYYTEIYLTLTVLNYSGDGILLNVKDGNIFRYSGCVKVYLLCELGIYSSND